MREGERRGKKQFHHHQNPKIEAVKENHKMSSAVGRSFNETIRRGLRLKGDRKAAEIDTFATAHSLSPLSLKLNLEA